MEKKHDPINEFLEKHIGKLTLITVVIFIIGYLVYSWYNSEPIPDEYYDPDFPGTFDKYRD